ncbi:MAG: hypothetical protein HZA17_10665 [Nitrospirae bacterium]|nr:hypothetical protein [Nitrospirota bacterium]
MGRGKVFSLFVAVVCTFCFNSAGSAADLKILPSEVGGRIMHAGVKHLVTGTPGQHVAASAAGRNRLLDQRTDMFRVLAVLETKIVDPDLLEKVRDKLSTMSEDRMRVAVSLSERVVEKAPEAETDVAFLLLTTLIIFS